MGGGEGGVVGLTAINLDQPGYGVRGYFLRNETAAWAILEMSSAESGSLKVH